MSATRAKDRRGRIVHAAGGVVWRIPPPGAGSDPDILGGAPSRPGGPAGQAALPDGLPAGLEFVMVHRPRYDDWSLPKGKAERGEPADRTALREVEEETGLVCALGDELVTVRYETVRGEDKTVRWWSMTVRQDLGFEPNDEVDEVRWVDHGEFSQLCHFDTDRDVVHSLAISGVCFGQL